MGMRNYKQFAIRLAEQAGKIIRKNFTLGMKKEWKTDNTPLVETDLMVNQLVLDSIKRTFPDHSILSEEGSAFSEKDEYVWVCDPLDGTNQFCRGVPLCAFSLALTQKGKSILGVVYDPFMDRMFFAEKSMGAFMNEKRIFVSSTTRVSDAQFGVVYWRDAPFDFSRLADAIRNKGGRVMQNISIAYMGALVAGGAFDGTIFPGNQPNDTAAVKVLVEEAGGKVTDVFGNEQRYDRPIKGHVASNGVLHEKLLARVRETLNT